MQAYETIKTRSKVKVHDIEPLPGPDRTVLSLENCKPKHNHVYFEAPLPSVESLPPWNNAARHDTPCAYPFWFFQIFSVWRSMFGPLASAQNGFWLSSDDQRALPLGRTEPRRRHRELTATHELEKKHQKTKQKCHNLSQFVYLNLIS